MITESVITVRSSLGFDNRYLHLMQEPTSPVLVVLFPGQGHRCDIPVLYYAREVALQLGFDTLSIEYGFQRAGCARTPALFEPTLRETIEALRHGQIEHYTRVYFISKSFGTLIAGETAQYFKAVDLRNLFLTPLAATVPYIAAAACTVIYGTADAYFLPKEAENISGLPHVKRITLPNATHSLEIENDYRASLDILSRLCVEYEQFLRQG